MGLFDDLIKNAVSGAVGDAVQSAVKKTVQPAADAAAKKAADSIAQAAEAGTDAARQSAEAASQAAAELNAAGAEAASAGGTQMPSQSELESAFGMLGAMMQSAADGAAKNLKICQNCGEAAEAEEQFCPNCGTKLPEMTVSQSLTCTKCGKQNKIGTKFCSGCGEKLPAALMEEQAAAQRDAEVLAKWAEILPEFPVWNCGGTDFGIDSVDPGIYYFAATLPDAAQAEKAVEAYRQLAMQAGFKQEGQYPSKEHLYLRVNGKSCHIDTEHCFESDANVPSIYFLHDEPTGGYDYKKPEPQPKKPGGLFGALFG